MAVKYHYLQVTPSTGENWSFSMKAFLVSPDLSQQDDRFAGAF